MAPMSMSAVDADRENVAEDQQGKESPGRLPRREELRHQDDGDHPEPGETAFGESDAEGGQHSDAPFTKPQRGKGDHLERKSLPEKNAAPRNRVIAKGGCSPQNNL